YPLPAAEQLTVLGRRPQIPPGMRVYAFGDIHGRLDLLEALLAQVERDLAVRPVERPLFIFLGDYIDRGPASRKTIDRLSQLSRSQECIFLKGNHEALAIRGLTDRAAFDRWMRLGGFETLVSYGVTPGFLSAGPSRPVPEIQATFHAALATGHMQFFRNLQTSFALGDFFFVHAGVRPGVELSQQAEEDLLWIRSEFLDASNDFGKVVVHGHTPTKAVEVTTNRVNIDTGAFATGRLSCLVVEGAALSVIDTVTSTA
ncbi:MAG: metallophosphoesterase family protein, partial [Bradyrhizobium sp.]|nr:metallophosphoesterase family protein [Bradyrhizobium sp.]